jgi:hypothetical protein
MGLSDELEPHYHSDEERAQLGDMRPDVFVSILDPLKDPPFIPSPMRSLPLWMDLLPNNVFRERMLQSRKSSESKQKRRASEQLGTEREGSIQPLRKQSWHFWHGAGIQVMPADGKAGPIEPTSGDTTPRKTSMSETCAPTPRRRSRFSESITPRKPSLPGTTSTVVPPPQDSSSSKRGRRITIAFDPNIKKERYSEDFEDTPPTYKRYRQIEPTHDPTKQSTAPPPRERTPWPILVPDPTIRPTDYFTPNSKTAAAPKPPVGWRSGVADLEERTYAAPSSSSRQPEVACPTPRPCKPPLLSMSSEYLERYKPQSPSPKIEKYVAKEPKPVLERMGRRRSSILGVDDGVVSKIPGVTRGVRPLAGVDDGEEVGGKGDGSERDGKETSRDALQQELERVLRERQFGM